MQRLPFTRRTNEQVRIRLPCRIKITAKQSLINIIYSQSAILHVLTDCLSCMYNLLTAAII